MNFSEPAIWYMNQERHREAMRRRNENIMQRRLFELAESRGLISIDQGHVTVMDARGAIAHFSHHPDLVNMCPGLGWALQGDVSRLEPALNEVWRQVSAG